MLMEERENIPSPHNKGFCPESPVCKISLEQVTAGWDKVTHILYKHIFYL